MALVPEPTADRAGNIGIGRRSIGYLRAPLTIQENSGQNTVRRLLFSSAGGVGGVADVEALGAGADGGLLEAALGAGAGAGAAEVLLDADGAGTGATGAGDADALAEGAGVSPVPVGSSCALTIREKANITTAADVNRM